MGMYYSLFRLSKSEAEDLKGNDNAIEEFMEEAPQECHLDKAWDAVHFLLTGNIGEAPFPAGFLHAGEPISEDWGYGPVRLLSQVQVKRIAKFLSEFDEAEFKRRFDFDKMAELEIYPSIIWERKQADDKEWVVSTTLELQKFIIEAASVDQVIVTMIT